MKNRILGIVLFALCSTSAVHAQTTQEAKSIRQMNTVGIGKDIVTVMHFGTKYKSHQFNGKGNVIDNRGNVIPGEYYLEYEFKWDGGGGIGTTTASFFFDRNGNMKDIKIDNSDAVTHRPFLMANLGIAVTGQLIKDSLGDQLTNNQRDFIDICIKNTNSKGLLELYLLMKLD